MIQKAVPKISEYRERYVSKTLRLTDVRKPKKKRPPLKIDDGLRGPDFIGPGLEVDIEI